MADLLYDHVATEMGWEAHPSFEAAARAASSSPLGEAARGLLNSSVGRRLATTAGKRSSSRSSFSGKQTDNAPVSNCEGASAGAGCSAGGGGLAALGGMITNFFPKNKREAMKRELKVSWSIVGVSSK